jgi:hypothetical protein
MKIINIFLWVIAIVFFWSIFNQITTDKKVCGYDNLYDNNCDLFR